MARLDSITKIVKSAVFELCRRRCNSKGFLDDGEVREKAFVSTCEGLDCIFMSCLNFEDIKLATILNDFPDLLSYIKEDVEYLISRCLKKGVRKKTNFPGDPYLGKSKHITQKNQIPNLDSTAFAISMFLHLRELIKEKELSKKDFSVPQIEEIIKEGLNEILGLHISKKGWPWGKGGKKSQVYFSWSIIETLNEVFEYDKDATLFGKYDSLIKAVGDTKKWIETEYLPKMAEWGNLEDEIELYLYVESLIIVTLVGTDSLEHVADFLFRGLMPRLDKIASQSPSCNYPIDGRPNAILSDDSIIPLLLRGVSAALLRFGNKERFMREIDGIAVVDYKRAIQKCFELVNQKLTDGGLWAYDSKIFEIYYTERTIEALIIYYYYYSGKKQFPKLTTMKPSPESDKDFNEFKSDLEKAIK